MYFILAQAHKLQFRPESGHARPFYRRIQGPNYLHFVLIARSPLKKLQLLPPLGHLWLRLVLPRSSSGCEQLSAEQEELGVVRARHQRNTTVKRRWEQSALCGASRDEVLTTSSSLSPVSAQHTGLPYTLPHQPLSCLCEYKAISSQ